MAADHHHLRTVAAGGLDVRGGALSELFLVTRGTSERRAQVDAFATAAEEAGGEVTVVDLPAFSHEDVNRRIGILSWFGKRYRSTRSTVRRGPLRRPPLW